MSLMTAARSKAGGVLRRMQRLPEAVAFWLGAGGQARRLSALPVEAIKAARSVEELRRLVDRHPLDGFNGQVLRAAYLAWLYETLGCTSFLETGTRWGYTAISAKLLFGGPVFTVELLRKNYWHGRLLAKLALGAANDLHFQHGDSRIALAAWMAGEAPGARPMVYLDAHFFEDLPLAKEVELAVERGHCVIVIDDFKIPHDTAFGWDKKRGYEIKMEVLADVLPPDRVRVLYPAHAAREETGYHRGTCIILVDLDLPDAPDQFPATLFKDAD